MGELLGHHSTKRQAEHVGALDGELIEQASGQRREVAHREQRLPGQHPPGAGQADLDPLEPAQMAFQRLPRGRRHPHPIEQHKGRPRTAAPYAKMVPSNIDEVFGHRRDVGCGAS